MLVKSFLAIPKPSLLFDLRDFINRINNCEVTTPSKGEDVLIVVTECKDQQVEDELLLKIHSANSLDHLVLVSSFNEAN